MLKQKLRIGMLASNFIRIPPMSSKFGIPPFASGAPEIVVSDLTEELVKRGHDVTLFASGNSLTTAKLVSVTPTETWNTVGVGPHVPYEHVLISRAYKMAQEGAFDVIHSHYDIRTAPFAPLVKTPTISTLHSPLDDGAESLVYFKNTQYYASISNNQRKPIPDLNYATTAYNAVHLDKIPFGDRDQKEDYLIFAGRIIQKKGPAEAIQIAKRTNQRLMLAGPHAEEDPFWQKVIKPQIDGTQIIYKDLMPREELYTYFAKAKAFIFPLHWEEPFGLVAAEALASGTPTIAFARGSMPEVISHGETGFLGHTLEELVGYTKKIDQIDPAACRKRAQDMFSIEKVVDRYEEAYKLMLGL